MDEYGGSPSGSPLQRWRGPHWYTGGAGLSTGTTEGHWTSLRLQYRRRTQEAEELPGAIAGELWLWLRFFYGISQ